MKKSIILLMSIFVFSTFALKIHAQDRRMNMAEFEKMKSEYIKQNAGLTDDEAQKYLPLNSEFARKKFELTRKYRENREAMANRSNLTDNAYKKLVDSNVELEMKQAELTKEYFAKFEKVLSPEKLYRAQEVEKEFLKRQVQRFNDERGGR